MSHDSGLGYPWMDTFQVLYHQITRHGPSHALQHQGTVMTTSPADQAFATQCRLLLIAVATLLAHQAHGQPGFITIDCGIEQGNDYTDDITKMTFTSDAGYVDAGTNFNISLDNLASPHPVQLSNLRSFPAGTRNCYTLKPIEPRLKYIVRATFLYGNYDGLNSASPERPLQFDLYLGTNKWVTVNFTNASEGHSTEVITVVSSSSKYLSVCLVNTGFGTPFISLLELRPLKNNLYPAVNASTPMVLQFRGDIGSTTNLPVRYPDDPYDRVWKPKNNMPGWDYISTPSAVDHQPDDLFEAPSAVMKTAATTFSNSTKLEFSYTSVSGWGGTGTGTRSQYYFIMHFADLVQDGRSRFFDIYLNGELMFGPYTPDYLLSGYFYSDKPQMLYHYLFSIIQEEKSTLPPILNALEIYTVMPLPELETNDGDVNAITAIKEQYLVQRNWIGDPCAPSAYAWDGLTCNYSTSEPPRIITVNLSLSGLNGEIPPSFANLATLNYLDLSYNNLTGTIPDYLGELSSLQLLNLSGNQFTGSIPPALLLRSEKGLLILRTDGNPHLCINWGSCETGKKKIIVPIIVILSVISAVLLLGAILCVWRIRRKPQGFTLGTPMIHQNEDHRKQILDREVIPFPFDRQIFTCRDLKKITNNFERVIGKGGFGTVYYGCLECGTEVAVKMHSQSSQEANRQILAEAQFLIKIHHRNLVSLVGYCNEDNSVALVFEYMAEGCLAKHLSGKFGNERSSSWANRLSIALEAAQGLEYLHTGCRPPIIHRDVKSSNILLSQNLEAKIADFGLSKAFRSDSDTHISTMVAGTLGYLDPEYQTTFQLTVKSDVYSFGVVLLELITGQPAILKSTERVHISQWVNLRLAKSDISDVVDPRVKGESNFNSIWKVTELAMKCMMHTSSQRPTIDDVVLQLKESMELAASCSKVLDARRETPGSFEIALMDNAGFSSCLSPR